MLDSFLAPLLGQAAAQLFTTILGGGVFAVGVPWLIELVKRSDRFPQFDEYSSTAAKIAAGIAGALAAAGISSALDIEAGTFVVTGITTSGLGKFAVLVMQQLGLQELAYQWLFKRARR
jgi:hypothetical protein